MDASLRVLSQLPFLHQLVLLAVLSVEWKDERQAVYRCTYPAPSEPPFAAARQAACWLCSGWATQHLHRRHSTGVSTPALLNERGWCVWSDFFIYWARKKKNRKRCKQTRRQAVKQLASPSLSDLRVFLKTKPPPYNPLILRAILRKRVHLLRLRVQIPSQSDMK